MSLEDIPGLAASIVKDGQVVWKAAYGMANIENNTPVTLETEFTLASISKLFTATACAQLWEDGLLDLDENINSYLPIEIVNPNHPDSPITARQLLTHKSSLHDYESDLQLWDAPGDPIFGLADFCAMYFVPGGALYDASNFGNGEPGNSMYWYSNAGFTLLGYLVESISGVGFNVYCQQNILDPLEMSSSGWSYMEVDSAGIAMPYNTSWQPYGYFSVPEYPAAMLKANVEELSNFLITYTQKGLFEVEMLVSEETFEMLVPESMTNGLGWWGMDTWYGDANRNFWSHGGYMNGVRTQLNYYPSDSTGLIILTNGEGDYSQIQEEIEAYIPLFESSPNTSLSELENLSLRLYPNPLTEPYDLYVESPSEFGETWTVKVLSLDGRVVKESSSISGLLRLNLSDVALGMYALTIEAKKQAGTKILMIK